MNAVSHHMGGELQEVFDFFEQLRNERDVYHAIGKQLDGVGDIAVLTRKEAGQLAGDPILKRGVVSIYPGISPVSKIIVAGCSGSSL